MASNKTGSGSPVTAMYVILEYLVIIALALVLGAFAFGVSVVALLGQEGGKRLAATSRVVRQHAEKLLAESHAAPNLLADETEQPGQ